MNRLPPPFLCAKTITSVSNLSHFVGMRLNNPANVARSHSTIHPGKGGGGEERCPRNEVLDLLSTESLLKCTLKKEKKIEGFNPGLGLVDSPSLSIFSGTKYRFLFTLMGTCGGRKSPLFHPRTPWLGACIQHLEMIIALHAQRMDVDGSPESAKEIFPSPTQTLNTIDPDS